ncbi:MAG: FG-GAP repeat domain-containing protein [Nevskiales bacterium]
MKARKVLNVVASVAGITLCATAQAGISFAPAVNYSTGSNGGPGPAAQSMITADVNGDGAADVVAADWFGSGIRVFMNNGIGSFGPAIVTHLGTSTGSVDAGDFDFDGKADVATATGSELVILHGLGNGSFTETERFPLSVSGQVQAYVFDTNLDGRADIVAPTGSGVQVFLGQGNGHFVTGPLSPVSGFFSALSKANFNNDGIPDIALADAGGQRAIMMRGNGNGSFTQFATGTVGLGPEDIITGDLNRDGVDDIATADSFSFTVSVLLSNGQGSFSAATRYSGDMGPVSLRLADFDRDGDLDIAESAVGSSVGQVFANNGNGQFAAPLVLSTTNQPQTPAIADYNRDGKPDIAVAGPGQMSILRNTSP